MRYPTPQITAQKVQRFRLNPVTIACLLAGSIQTVPLLAEAASGSQVADGVHLDVAAGDYATTSDNQHALHALNGGSIDAVSANVNTSGNGAAAAWAEDDTSQIKLEGGSLSTSGFGAAGAVAKAGATINIERDSAGNGTVIHTTGDNSEALVADGGGVINITGATLITEGSKVIDSVYGAVTAKGAGVVTIVDSTIETTGSDAFGALAYGAGSTININGGSVTTSGTGSQGVAALDGGHAVIGIDDLTGLGTTIHTTGAGSAALAAIDATMEVMGATIKTEGDSMLDEGEERVSAGVAARSGSSVKVVDSTIETTGNKGNGIDVAGSTVEMSGGSIFTKGSDARGVATYAGGSAWLNDVEIHTEGEAAHGAITNGGDIQLANTRINTTGLGSFGLRAINGGVINATNSGILTTGDNATGVSVGSIVNLKDSHVRTEGADAWGADVSGTLNVDGGSLVSAKYGALTATGDAIINLSNNTQVIGGNGILLSISDEVNNVSLDLDNQVYAEGDIVFAPDADSGANGTLDSNTKVSLSNASHWKGKTDAIDTLSLSQDSQWTVTGDSTVGQLSIDQGRVVFDAPDAGAFKTLSVTGDLSGNGSFLLNTDLSSVQGDLLKVAGQIEGEHTLIVADSGREAQGDALMLVDGNGGAGKFDLYGGKVDAGAFRYELEQRGDDWYLAGRGSISHDDPEDLSKGSNVAVAQHSASAALIGAQMNTLVKRLGELRMGKDEGGLWTRGFSKEQHIDTGSSRAFQQQVSGFEIGADKAIPFYNGKLYLGGMVGKGEARQNFGEGSKGTVDSAMLGSYATYVDNSGVYVDSVLKYTRLNNKADITSNIGEKVDAKYKNHATAVDVEVGKQIDLGEGWFVEPQLGVQAFRVSSGDYTSSNGLKVEQDAVTSVQSRIGSMFGRNLKLDNGMAVQPYAKALWLTEHAGDSHVKVNGTSLDSKLPGSRVEIGGGVILQTAEKHKFYIDAEYSKGDGIEQPYAVNVGYRYMW